MKPTLTRFQLGKQGITENVVASLANAFKNRRQVRISCLKSSGREKANMLEIAKELKEKLPLPVNIRIIGFTIILIKASTQKPKK